MSWVAVKLFLRAIPWQLWAALAVLALLLAIHHHGVVAGRDQVQAKFDAYRGQVIGATAVATQRARAEEARQRAAFAQIGTNYLEAKDEARRKGDALAAAVRAGTVRLRHHWACPAGVPGAAGPAGAADAGAELRAAAAGRIVRIGAEADAQVNGLQALLKAERMRPIER